MLETIERVERLNLTNITVINYHSLGVRYYSPECSTDMGLRRVVLLDTPVFPHATLPDADVIVMDEQQDMTPCLKLFIDKVIRDMNRVGKIRLVTLGDERQEMYGFNNSDARFLTFASKPEVFGYLNREEWVEIDQPQSNRVTKQNVAFINEQLLHPPIGGREMLSGKPYNPRDPKPRYIITDTWSTPVREIQRLLALGLKPEEIIVLAPSVRGPCPIIRLMNTLTLLGYPTHVADSDISEVSPEVSRGKILACTYHQAKGIEREAAIIFGFDISYHTYYHRTAEPMVAASNAQYVAATRAKKHLILLHDEQHAALPFINTKTLANTVDLVITDPIAAKDALSPAATSSEIEATLPIAKFSVTSLTRNLPSTLIIACLRHLKIHHIASPAFGPIPPSQITDQFGLTEGVSEITGTAVPSIYQYLSREHLDPKYRTCSLVSSAQSILKKPMERSYSIPSTTDLSDPVVADQLEVIRAKLTEIVERWEETHTLDTPDILFLAAIHSGHLSNLVTKLISIPLSGYNWLEPDVVKDMVDTLSRYLKPRRGLKFEAPLIATVQQKRGPSALVRGAADAVRISSNPSEEPSIVWEVKYTDALAPQHILQTAVYAAQMAAASTIASPTIDPTTPVLLPENADKQSQRLPPPRAFLINAKSGQAVEITGDFGKVLRKLVAVKTGVESGGLVEDLDDEEFMREAGNGWVDWESEVGVPEWFAERPSGRKVNGRRVVRKGKKEEEEVGGKEKLVWDAGAMEYRPIEIGEEAGPGVVVEGGVKEKKARRKSESEEEVVLKKEAKKVSAVDDTNDQGGTVPEGKEAAPEANGKRTRRRKPETVEKEKQKEEENEKLIKEARKHGLVGDATKKRTKKKVEALRMLEEAAGRVPLEAEERKVAVGA